MYGDRVTIGGMVVFRARQLIRVRGVHRFGILFLPYFILLLFLIFPIFACADPGP